MLSSSSDRCSCESREAVRTLPRTMHRSTRHTQRHPCEILIVSSAREVRRSCGQQATSNEENEGKNSKSRSIAKQRKRSCGLVNAPRERVVALQRGVLSPLSRRSFLSSPPHPHPPSIHQASRVSLVSCISTRTWHRSSLLLLALSLTPRASTSVVARSIALMADQQQLNIAEAAALAQKAAAELPPTDYIKLFIGQLPKTYSEELLRPIFEPFGEIHEFTIIRDKVTGAHRGCAFLTYTSKTAADNAIAALHNTRTFKEMTHPLQVKYADGEVDKLGMHRL